MAYLEDKAMQHLEKAKKDSIPWDARIAKVELELKFAQIYATLAVAEAINKLGKGR